MSLARRRRSALVGNQEFALTRSGPGSAQRLQKRPDKGHRDHNIASRRDGFVVAMPPGALTFARGAASTETSPLFARDGSFVAS